LRAFETEVAQRLDRVDALFLPSGVMAQSIVLAESGALTGSSTFVCHRSSHILNHEKNAYSELLGMTTSLYLLKTLLSFNQHYDIKMLWSS
jgi:threonine aldolase